ncbi:hypothetical protein [Phytohabitans kaempferiae]|uniref:Roadblock/LAMTOR2 domain-containing protein n=1 Tax=Phytohabitans kaempferiae TaxID=1620943 RepID=A0ABV6MCW8_9ACTN
MSGIDACLARAMAIHGAIGASIVDHTTGFAIGARGRAPTDDPDATWSGTAAIVNVATTGSPFASTRPGDGIEDVIITTLDGYHLIQQVRTVFDSRLVLYLWLDRTQGNLAMARRQLRLLAEGLAGTPAPPDPAAASGPARAAEPVASVPAALG